MDTSSTLSGLVTTDERRHGRSGVFSPLRTMVPQSLMSCSGSANDQSISACSLLNLAANASKHDCSIW